VLFDGPGTLVVDSVSLFPTANVRRGEAEGLANPWPFRQDLLDALKALSPRWVGWVGGHREFCVLRVC
jgi:alpha-N-arabinofuranosidase